MSQLWHRGQIDALALPNGSFISAGLTRKRIESARNNTTYREALEKASRMAGYVDPALSLATSRITPDNERALFKQNEKAERLIKEKRDGSSTDSIDADM